MRKGMTFVFHCAVSPVRLRSTFGTFYTPSLYPAVRYVTRCVGSLGQLSHGWADGHFAAHSYPGLNRAGGDLEQVADSIKRPGTESCRHPECRTKLGT